MKALKIYLYTAIGFLAISCSKKEETAEETKGDPNVISITQEQIKVNGIKFGKAEYKNIEAEFLVSGIIRALPENKASVHSQVDGFIEKVNFISGQYVQKGQVLATVKNANFTALQKQFLESYFNMNLNQKDYQRKKSLLDADAISKRSYEQALAAYQVSQAEYESLRSELSLLGFNPSAIQSSRKINPILVIRSPKSGFIQALEVFSGKQITSSDELFLIVNQDQLNLELNVPVKFASKIFEGQDVEFKLPEINSVLKAKINLVGKVTDTQTNAVLVQARIVSVLPSTNLYEGRFVDAKIIDKTQSLLSLPKEAVVEEDGNKFVFVKKEDGKIQKKQVQTGYEDDKFVEIMDWNSNQIVVVSGAYYLKSGFSE